LLDFKRKSNNKKGLIVGSSDFVIENKKNCVLKERSLTKINTLVAQPKKKWNAPGNQRHDVSREFH
jgi:hypothetical protein